jgi:hypothetical protein
MRRSVLVAALLILSLRASAQDMAPLDVAALGGPPGLRVAGRDSVARGMPCDVVLALDASASAFLPSERDVDGDGVIGALSGRGTRWAGRTPRPAHAWTTDPGDTVFELSRAVARRLLDSLPQQGVRVGLLTFSEQIRVRARLGSAENALRALDSLRAPFHPGATNLGGAIHAGEDMLVPWSRDRRDRILILVMLSDGRATWPGPPVIASRAARLAALAAGRNGVLIVPVGVGPHAVGQGSEYARLAALRGGEYGVTDFDLSGLSACRATRKQREIAAGE